MKHKTDKVTTENKPRQEKQKYLQGSETQSNDIPNLNSIWGVMSLSEVIS